MSKIIVKNRNGYELDFYTAVGYMDSGIMGLVSDLFEPCSEQVFFSAYEDAHEFAFGEEWELSKENPCL